jgi:predicted NAD/FAD-binding protein
MRVAVIGTGISGMSCAYLLAREHSIEVFEQNDYVGGHTNTVSVDDVAETLGIDTGFIVHNPRNYPNLVRLFEQLGVATQDCDMSFSVRCHRCNLEYAPPDVRTLFAQKRNILRPSFYRLMVDARRFPTDAREFTSRESPHATLSEFIAEYGYSDSFARHFLIPLAASIWSSSPEETAEMPARFCLQFFDNHGMLDLVDKPTWRTVVGGSRQYVRAITAGYKERIRVGVSIKRVTRSESAVAIEDDRGEQHRFDAVVIAAHADQAVRMLSDPSDDERSLLGAFRYSRNHTVLHTDPSVLPRRPALHCSWNYELDDCRVPARRVSLTYYMNRLQRLTAGKHYCVTLNRSRPITESRVLRRFEYEHPIFNRDTARAQPLLTRLNGVRRTWFCGSYFGHGFHEDGLNSALAVAKDFGISL